MTSLYGDARPKNSRPAARFLVLLLVLLIVLLNLAGAWVMKFAASLTGAGIVVVASLVGAVIAVNIGRVLAWGFVHRRFALARSYPLTAIFYPLVAGLSWAQGDPVTLQSIFGVLMITAGVVWYTIYVPGE